MTWAIEARDVGVLYPWRGAGRGLSLKDLVLRPAEALRSGRRAFTALDGVSFSVAAGETVGIIGENGSGKSTLLRTMAGIFRPDRGKITTRGRLTGLLELGAGFHDELTGRENVMLNGALLGLSDLEMRRLLPRIEAFAEIGQFIAKPVRTYSTGMRVRLGFAVATACDPDILLIDEVLAVGDERFQQKCLLHIENVRLTTTVLLVTHNLTVVASLCPRVLVLDAGKLVFDGESAEGVRRYREMVRGRAIPAGGPVRAETGRGSVVGVALTSAGPERVVAQGERMLFRVEASVAEAGLTPSVVLAVVQPGGGAICSVRSHPHVDLSGYRPGIPFAVEFALAGGLLEGEYQVNARIDSVTSAGTEILERVVGATAFRVAGAPAGIEGIIDLVEGVRLVGGGA